jgi:hypothetical protein
MFFGRNDVFAFIRQRLIAGRRAQSMAIIGQRGIGKTSVLLQVPRQIETNYVTAYLDLSDVRFDAVGGLFAAMADVARQALEASGLSTYRLPPIPDDPAVDLMAWFSETYLDVTLSALRSGRRLIFLFDDTSKLLDAIDRRDVPADLGDTLSALIARDERMDIIFAVDAEDEHRLEAFAPLNDPLLHKRLGLLDDSAAEALTRRPAAPYYEVQNDAVEGILAMTGGYPYLLHVLNGLLWERVAARREPFPSVVTLNDVSSVLRQAVDESDPVLRQTWTRSTANERLALSALTALTVVSRGMPVRGEDVRLWLLRESNSPLDATALASALRRLEYREVLRAPTKGTYTFSTGLQHQWLVLNGDAQPSAAIPTATRPNLRRFVIPAVLLIIVAVGLALLIGRLSSTTPPETPGVIPTVTLDQDIIATRNAISATQTFAALPTRPPSTNTPESLVPATSVIVDSSPTSVIATVQPTDTPVQQVTLNPSLTPTPIVSNTPTTRPLPTLTSTPSVTAPPFPTGQIRAPATLSP